MQHPLRIDLPTPCAERWDGMTPVPGGRHCGACAKTVIDFTGFSDDELFAYLSRRKATVCGRLTTSQIGKTIPPPPRRIFPLFGGLRAAGLFLCASLFSSAASAQQKQPARPRSTTAPGRTPASQLPVMGSVRVMGHWGVTGRMTFGITINGVAQSVTTDSDGHFVIHLPRKPLFTLTWPDQETPAGMIVGGELKGRTADPDKRLQITIVTMMRMDQVVVEADAYRPGSSGSGYAGIMPYQEVRTVRKPFFKRMTAIFHRRKDRG